MITLCFLTSGTAIAPSLILSKYIKTIDRPGVVGSGGRNCGQNLNVTF